MLTYLKNPREFAEIFFLIDSYILYIVKRKIKNVKNEIIMNIYTYNPILINCVLGSSERKFMNCVIFHSCMAVQPWLLTWVQARKISAIIHIGEANCRSPDKCVSVLKAYYSYLSQSTANYGRAVPASLQVIQYFPKFPRFHALRKGARGVARRIGR